MAFTVTRGNHHARCYARRASALLVHVRRVHAERLSSTRLVRRLAMREHAGRLPDRVVDTAGSGALVADPLGADPELAELILDRYEAAALSTAIIA